jgi:3-deoxy-D-manno-octulosonate 8-phosphate phosphatase (KDO 8-P phosphatase)
LADWKEILISPLSAEIIEKVKRIRLLALDSDGVLTDGGVYIADDGYEFRRFDIKDGLGLKRVMQAGVKVAIISSASCEAVRVRADGLGIEHVYLGVQDKLTCLQQVCGHLGISMDQVAYMGDDLPDLEVFQVVGLSIAPADAVEEACQAVSYVTTASSGRGAVRELCCLLETCITL